MIFIYALAFFVGVVICLGLFIPYARLSFRNPQFESSEKPKYLRYLTLIWLTLVAVMLSVTLYVIYVRPYITPNAPNAAEMDSSKK